MQFSYRITEAEYLRACKLRRKRLVKFGTGKVILFWLLVLICLCVLYGVIAHTNSAPPPVEAPHPADSTGNSLLVDVLLYVLILGVWIFLASKLIGQAGQARKIYRKDPLMQGTFTVDVTPDSLTTSNTAGTKGQAEWNIYEYWSEDKNLVVLVMRSQACLLMSLTNLGETERSEVRGILSAALPKK